MEKGSMEYLWCMFRVYAYLLARRERTWWADGTREYERAFESMFASGTATGDTCTLPNVDVTAVPDILHVL